MSISAKDVQKLRKMTDAGFMDCKKALAKTDGDIDKAVDELRKAGIAKANKKLGRDAGEGRIFSYIHTNQKIGVMVELFCETDFVAKTPDFQQLGNDIAMHIAAANPIAVKREDVDEDTIAKEREIFMDQAKKMGKPEKVLDRIVDGKIDKFFKERILMEQEFIKDPDSTIEEMIKQFIGKVGENIQVGNFYRSDLTD
ncbi:MAG: translation elongation factor Ts [Candidatus Zixiibacteriota bacterium]